MAAGSTPPRARPRPCSNPATGEVLGTVPAMSAADTRAAIQAAHAALPGWRAQTAKDRATVLKRLQALMLQHQDDLASHHDRRAGQAARRVARRDRLCGRLHRMVRRGGPAGLRRRDTRPRQGPAHPRAEAAGGRRRVHHALELPVRDDRPQDRPGARGRMHGGGEAGAARRRTPRSRSRTSPRAPALPPGVFNVVTGSGPEIGGELTANPLVRKLTFTGSTEVGKLLIAQCAATVKKVSMELGRQCAVHRLRRRRPRCRRHRRHGEQVPQHRPDLRLRQPAAGAGEGLRRVREAPRRRGRQAARGRRTQGRDRPGPADRHGRGGKGRGAHRGRGRQGRPGR